ncbi:MAG: zinc D-Ala-D-Ala dipeptidase [Burkholderiales bacterium]
MNDIRDPEMHRNLALVASLAQMEADPDFVDLALLPKIAIDLRYASANNFMGVDLYGAFNRAFLRKAAALQLHRAVEALSKSHPDHRITVLDATRPRSVQRRLWAHVVGTQQECYVANPDSGSIHNFGFAVDVTILDASGKELDMGTAFDAFDDLSQPALEEQHWREWKLSDAQMENRRLLRESMAAGGYAQHPFEWWHFDAIGQVEARTYSIVE